MHTFGVRQIICFDLPSVSNDARRHLMVVCEGVVRVGVVWARSYHNAALPQIYYRHDMRTG